MIRPPTAPIGPVIWPRADEPATATPIPVEPVTSDPGVTTETEGDDFDAAAVTEEG